MEFLRRERPVLFAALGSPPNTGEAHGHSELEESLGTRKSSRHTPCAVASLVQGSAWNALAPRLCLGFLATVRRVVRSTAKQSTVEGGGASRQHVPRRSLGTRKRGRQGENLMRSMRSTWPRQCLCALRELRGRFLSRPRLRIKAHRRGTPRSAEELGFRREMTSAFGWYLAVPIRQGQRIYGRAVFHGFLIGVHLRASAAPFEIILGGLKHVWNIGHYCAKNDCSRCGRKSKPGDFQEKCPPKLFALFLARGGEAGSVIERRYESGYGLQGWPEVRLTWTVREPPACILSSGRAWPGLGS